MFSDIDLIFKGEEELVRLKESLWCTHASVPKKSLQLVRFTKNIYWGRKPCRILRSALLSSPTHSLLSLRCVEKGWQALPCTGAPFLLWPIGNSSPPTWKNDPCPWQLGCALNNPGDFLSTPPWALLNYIWDLRALWFQRTKLTIITILCVCPLHTSFHLFLWQPFEECSIISFIDEETTQRQLKHIPQGCISTWSGADI